ncbi:chromatin assembly factor 1 subunit A-domain-containing protein [Aspergillus karnatakaensis]|uniref:putative chromatin assembly factor 1 subunit A n=1 Tax=Aspergillus karnatakaensis TaxID=1810916 RepID=UPI003CCCA3C8
MSPHSSTGAGAPTAPSTNNSIGQNQPQAGTGGFTTPAAKKRKLTPAEKEAKQQEKEAKERQKQEEKTKKDEEKAKKEEEKRKKDAEKEEERKKKEEKKKAKDEEKAAKEEERRKKEEEKTKKERAQTKLNSFFAKPKSAPTQNPPTVSPSPKKPSGGETPTELTNPEGSAEDYKRAFPDFFLQSHTYLAPPHRFQRDAEALAHLQAKVDSSLAAGSTEPLAFRPSELFRMIPYKRRRGCQKLSVREILHKLQSLSDLPETSEASWKLHESLKNVRMKSLKFGEDVRPPYQGTYTKDLSMEAAARLMRNPFRRELPEVNYDYDSEAEWEDAEEGEELDSEEEEEGSEDGDEDMDGFLDDEDDQLVNGKRRLLVGELEPVCTGIKWQDQGSDPELKVYKLETILPTVTLPIDPFSTSYWQKPKQPQRFTWLPVKGNTASQLSGSLAVQDGNTAPGGKPKRTLPTELLSEFRMAVEGSNLSKTGLIEVLKKRFPKVSKGTLKDTLDSIAVRVGQKEVDKKWMCR